MDNILRFIHITDTHIGPSPDYTLHDCNTYAALDALVAHLNHDLPFVPDFILHTGDVAYDPDPAAYPLAQNLLRQFKYPVYYVRGNHDDPDTMRQILPNLPAGTGRLDYDFTIRDFHFIVLDSFGHVQPAGYLEDYQLAWLEKTCQSSTARSLVIVLHHLPIQTGVGWYDAEMMIENHNALFAILSRFQKRIRGLFFGHIHRGSTTLRDGILCSSAPAVSMQFESWPTQTSIIPDTATPHGFNVVTLTHEQTWISQHHFGEGK